MGENQKALEYYKKSKDISEQLGDTNAVGTSLLNMGVANMSLKRYERALENFSQALAIKQKVNDEKDIAKIYSNLGVIYQEEKKYEMALDYFNLGLKLHESMNDRRGITASLVNLGAVYLDIKEYDKSLDFLQRALALAQEIDMKISIKEVYGYLSNWYESQGRYKTALKYFELQSALGDTLFTIEKSVRIRNLQIVYEVEKKDKEILEQSVSIREYQSRQLYFLLTILSILGVAFIFYYRYRLKKRVNRVLEEKIAEALKLQKEQQQIIVHQASLTSLGELAAGIAHEIKQPLQNISLSNESLDMEFSEDLPDKKFIKKTIRDIYEDIKRIKFIINEISNFSRGQQEELCEPFNVNIRIKNAFSLARTKFSNRRIDVKFELDENIPDIVGNPYKFEQVVVNFFNNAKDAIEERAEKSKEEFKKWMLVKSFSDGKMVIVEVSDNGVGISEADKTNIFLPFYTTKALGKGTGLGLSISLGIIKEMNGFIELESTPMQRTTMRVKIPVSKK
jgi:signal transduction histidine kinase